ncbi:hypothetical protein DV515_00002078 [Chloebia gouldiae]|uniref:Uncharacterized protein n=1 Tax=Chloebia gouldiae TaxID=44316 RepID=A0A3L8SW27_CHLGU|nr:hypothetical protein DV515_00002078 [Chloebia gouldiae]
MGGTSWLDLVSVPYGGSYPEDLLHYMTTVECTYSVSKKGDPVNKMTDFLRRGEPPEKARTVVANPGPKSCEQLWHLTAVYKQSLRTASSENPAAPMPCLSFWAMKSSNKKWSQKMLSSDISYGQQGQFGGVSWKLLLPDGSSHLWPLVPWIPVHHPSSHCCLPSGEKPFQLVISLLQPQTLLADADFSLAISDNFWREFDTCDGLQLANARVLTAR